MHFLEHHTSTQTDPCLVICLGDESEAEHISEIVKQILDVLEYLHSDGKKVRCTRSSHPWSLKGNCRYQTLRFYYFAMLLNGLV